MSLNEDLETLSPEAEVQKAYDRSSGSSIGDIELHPWTIARHSVAMSMGCAVISAIGPEVKGLIEEATYSNILRDCIISLWLSSLSNKEVSRINSRKPSVDLVEVAFEWAEKNKIVYGSAMFLKGVSLLDSIVRNIYDSFFSIDGVLPEAKKKEDIIHLGKSE
jgi:hypothetical protein